MSETEIKLMIEQIGYTEFYRYYQEKDKEIESLNNIINELEKYLNNSEFRCPDDLYVSACDDTLNKLQELKEVNKE